MEKYHPGGLPEAARIPILLGGPSSTLKARAEIQVHHSQMLLEDQISQILCSLLPQGSGSCCSVHQNALCPPECPLCQSLRTEHLTLAWSLKLSRGFPSKIYAHVDFFLN